MDQKWRMDQICQRDEDENLVILAKIPKLNV